jgi:hypothetical protein
MIPFLSPAKYLALPVKFWHQLATLWKGDELLSAYKVATGRDTGKPFDVCMRKFAVVMVGLITAPVFVLCPALGAAACYFKIQEICPLVGQHWATGDWLTILGIINQLKGIDHSDDAQFQESLRCLADAHATSSDEGSKEAAQRGGYVNHLLDRAFYETHGIWGLCLRATLTAKECQTIMRRHTA